MTIATNTRAFKGTVLKVDDLAMGYKQTGEVTSIPQSFGSSKAKIDIATAADSVGKVDLGIPDYGEATFEFMLDMDDEFQAEMQSMYESDDIDEQIRIFKLVLPEGTKDTLTFTAFVVEQPLTSAFNDYVKMTLKLCVCNVRPSWGTS